MNWFDVNGPILLYVGWNGVPAPVIAWIPDVSTKYVEEEYTFINNCVPGTNVYDVVGTGIVTSVYVYKAVFVIKILDIYALPVLIVPEGPHAIIELIELEKLNVGTNSFKDIVNLFPFNQQAKLFVLVAARSTTILYHVPVIKGEGKVHRILPPPAACNCIYPDIRYKVNWPVAGNVYIVPNKGVPSLIDE